MNGRILVVDDSETVRAMVRSHLERAGFEVRGAEDGRSGMRILFSEAIDGVLLDVEMPELDGWQVLERIRDVSDVPVCMLTSHDDELTKVRGLRSGADDYVTKPFSNLELVARVEALVRRGRGRGGDAQGAGAISAAYEDAALKVDLEQGIVVSGGQEIALTPTEFRILAAFVRHPGQVLSADQLGELALGDGRDEVRDQVKLYVSRLRRKLAPTLSGGAPIETLRGFGYRYKPPTAA